MSFISPALPRIATAGLLYAALAAFANPAAAAGLTADQRAGLDALRQGDMRKLVVHETPVPAPDTAFTAPDGTETTFAASGGRIRLVNFWATWCAPCREEMPALAALAEGRAGDDFELVLVATGRNAPEAIDRFAEETGLDGFATATDPKSALARAMAVPGLPVTVILDRDGAEIARMLGSADWNGPDAQAVVDYLVALPAGS